MSSSWNLQKYLYCTGILWRTTWIYFKNDRSVFTESRGRNDHHQEGHTRYCWVVVCHSGFMLSDRKSCQDWHATEEALEVGQWCIWEQHLIILYELNTLKNLFFQWCTSSFQSNTIFVITNKARHSKQPSVRTKRRPVERKCFSCEHKCVFGAVTSQTSKALGACRPLPSSSSPHILLLMPVLYSINKYDRTNRLKTE